jgi:hypothetical protein
MARGEVTRLSGNAFGQFQVSCKSCHAFMTSLKKAQPVAEKEFLGTGWSVAGEGDEAAWMCPRCSRRRPTAAAAPSDTAQA